VNDFINAEAVNPSRVPPIIEMAIPSETESGEYARWSNLVHCIEAGDMEGMSELYTIFGNGLRYYLCRHTGPQDLDDRLHNLFILIIEAIKRGDIRQPERLMGFVRTVTHRQVLAHIRRVVAAKIEVPIEYEMSLASAGQTPEDMAILRQQEALVRLVMSELPARDREILRRFYLHEQSASTICHEMVLTGTQFRLLKSRAKARFGQLGKKRLRARPCVVGAPLCSPLRKKFAKSASAG
jgi:RNA polymerase sigma-70 factor, ECF subfamily